MKTTIDIADDLMMQGKKLAERENLTFRQLVEEGLHLALEKHQQKKKPFKWKPVTAKGKLTSEFANAGWEAIRGAIYEGRGA